MVELNKNRNNSLRYSPAISRIKFIANDMKINIVYSSSASRHTYKELKTPKLIKIIVSPFYENGIPKLKDVFD